MSESSHTESMRDRRLLEAYADGELAGADLRRAESLVSESPAARALVENLRQLRVAARRALLAPPVPAMLEPRVRRALASAAQRRTWRVRPLWPALAAAATVLLALGAWRMLSPSGPDVMQGIAIDAEALVVMHRAPTAESDVDPYGVRGSSSAVASLVLSEQARFPVHVPDLSSSGYMLTGARLCTPANALLAVQVHYRPTRGGEPISMFAMNRPVVLRHSQSGGGGGGGGGVSLAIMPAKAFDASEVEGVKVLVFNEERGSVVFCSHTALGKLRLLADVAWDARRDWNRQRGIAGLIRR